MRAVVFDAPAPDASTTRVAEVTVPEPGPGEVEIDVVAAGINFIDVMARRGDPGYAGAWPFVPGLEAAGTVLALGPGVEGLTPGDRVAAFVGSGGLAEVAVASARLMAPIPDGISWAAAAAAGGALTTAILLVQDVARLRSGETLVVHSAGGGVGQALAQAARAAGAATVVGTVGRPERVEAARAAGYDAVLVRDDRLVDAVRDRTGGRGADVILDPQGTALLDADLAVAAPGARIVLFGNAAGRALDPLPAGQLFALNASIAAFSLSRMARQLPDRVGAALSRALAALADGTLSVKPIEIAGLGGVAGVHDELAAGRGAGKRVAVLRNAG
ncbi:MAG: zinc-binding dehydrogenase [Actinobacteria bacterium]|nr:zinc-binding dehydrogenase [Actinomycetota bacterium]